MTFSELMTSNNAVAHLSAADLLWIDVPGEAVRWQASQLEKLSSTVKQLTSTQPDMKIIALAPFIKGLGFPHKRWKQFIRSWTPRTTTQCTCKWLDNTNYWHYHVRLFTRNVDIPECTCHDSNNKIVVSEKVLDAKFYFSNHLAQWIKDNWGQKAYHARPRTVKTAVPLTQESNMNMAKPETSPMHVGTREDTHPSHSPRVLCNCQTSNITDSTEGQQCTTAFPTDSRERQKAQQKLEKEQGIERVVKKKKKIVENHHDDCGEDLSSLGDINEPDDDTKTTTPPVNLAILDNIQFHMFGKVHVNGSSADPVFKFLTKGTATPKYIFLSTR